MEQVVRWQLQYPEKSLDDCKAWLASGAISAIVEKDMVGDQAAVQRQSKRARV